MDQIKIEDYYSIDDGDDYYPALTRVQDDFLNKNVADGWRRFRTNWQTVLIGVTKSIYNFSQPVDLFGMNVVGVKAGVELHFTNNTHGFICHSPKYLDDGEGTHPSGYGGISRLSDIMLVGSNGKGTVGITSHSQIEAYNVRVDKFGSHGWWIDAGVTRPQASNANRFYLSRCWAVGNGKTPDDGQPYGCGLYISGPDTNVGYTEQCYFGSNSGWGLDDSSFLGCTHNALSVSDNGHILDADDTFYGVLAGQKLESGIRCIGNNARTQFQNPYVEGSAFLDVAKPSTVLGGIGGTKTSRTKGILSGQFVGDWLGKNSAGDDFRIGEEGYINRFGSTKDHASYKYAMKFIPSDSTGQHKGFFRLDYANVNANVAGLLTGIASKAPDLRLLNGGRVVVLDHYQGADMVPVLYGTSTTPPTITADHPIGTTYTCTRPIMGQPFAWVVVIDSVTSTHPKIWKVTQKTEMVLP